MDKEWHKSKSNSPRNIAATYVMNGNKSSLINTYLEHDEFIPYPDYKPCNLRYGFEFAIGWKTLVDYFSLITSHLIEYLRDSVIQKDAYVHSSIIKAKFGTLRWQDRDNLIEPYQLLFRGYVSGMEGLSKITCEKCGRQGELINLNGGMIVVCEQHENYSVYPYKIFV